MVLETFEVPSIFDISVIYLCACVVSVVEIPQNLATLLKLSKGSLGR